MIQYLTEPSWRTALEVEFEKDYFKNLTSFVHGEYASSTIFPPRHLIFNALNLCPVNDVKVIILGQDPYHDVNQAHGLSFSVRQGAKMPPSLVNIFKELGADLNTFPPSHGNLEAWAQQGVLLLNATLTVRAHQAASHQKKGWEQLTDAIIKLLSERRNNLVFLLWGAYAGQKAVLIDQSRHLVLQSAHPSPLSAYRGFFGNRHFSRTNAYLLETGQKPIAW